MDTNDQFSSFKPVSTNNESFFESYKTNQTDKLLKQRLEDVLGPLSTDAFNELHPVAQNNFEEAIVQFIDANKSQPVVLDSPEPEHEQLFVEDDDDAQELKGLPIERNEPKIELIEPEPCPEWKNENVSRLIGSIQADAWCTRAGRDLIKFGDTVSVERSPSGKDPKKNGIVRFLSRDGTAFGRARESDANYMSALLDSGVCKFEATVIYADSNLKVGSTVNLQLNCYLLFSAFNTPTYSSGLKPHHRKVKTGGQTMVIDESKETHEEKLVRLKQLALVELFHKVGMIDDTLFRSYHTTASQNSGSTNSTNNKRSQPTSQLGKRSRDELDDLDEEGDGGVDQEQYDAFYGQPTQALTEMQEVEPSQTFGLSLHPYQKRGLGWMLSRESSDKHEADEEKELHPSWTELKWPQSEDSFFANLNNGELSLSKPTLSSHARGGILADEMGLGKTISALALVHTGVNESKFHSTLIVAPMSLLSQWESEVSKASKTPKSCGCFVYYGGQDLASGLSEFLHNSIYDHKVVITTYGTVVSEHKQLNTNKFGSKLGLLNTEFDRIILDEAHTIKNRNTRNAKACFALRGKRRWALTGTPVVNRLEDLYSLVKFVGVEPWDNFTYWRTFITEQYENLDTREKAMKTVRDAVAPIFLRRTKDMRDKVSNEPLVVLPEKVVELKRIPFSHDEQVLYSHLFVRVRKSVQDNVLEGIVKSRFTTILGLITRLKQVCCHPLLLSRQYMDGLKNNKRIKHEEDLSLNNLDEITLDLTASIEGLLERFAATPSISYTTEMLKSILDDNPADKECVICSEKSDIPVFTECLHTACRECMVTHINYMMKKNGAAVCHICRAPIEMNKLFVLDKDNKQLKPMNNMKHSSKIRALIQSLQERKDTKRGKAVIFSCYTSFLDLIQASLADLSIPVYRFDGSMTQEQRSTAVHNFNADKNEDAVILLSLKAGGVGLNLVAANQAYMMDPWWNYSTESQAIDRIHRMGQTDSVKVIRFIIEGSIEEKIIQIQDRKKELSSKITPDNVQEDDLRVMFDLDEAAEKIPE